jgi:glycosyltransferase involved in cell wall biosynthesis
MQGKTLVEIEDSAHAKVVLTKETLTGVQPFVVVGIPAFNEEKSIARVILQSQKYADKVVVCDDGSTDLTPEIAQRLGAIVVRHARNQGYGSAVQSLFDCAKDLNADVLVTLDGDGQHDPAEIPAITKPIIEGSADVVVGSRLVDSGRSVLMPWYRRVGVRFLTRLTNGATLQNGVKDGQSGFRAYNRESIEKLVVFEDGMGASSEILINARKQHLRVCEVSASCNYNNGLRTSTRHPVRHGVAVMASIVKLVVEDSPLIMLGVPGFLSLMAGVSFGCWMLQLYASEHRIVTNIALASIAFVLIGLFFVFTAVTLYAISRTVRKANSRH